MKLRLTYLLLALTAPNREPEKNIEILKDSEGIVWSNFNLWLDFQANFIDRKSWAKTPIIKGVTLVNTEEIDPRHTRLINASDIDKINKSAEIYFEAFTGVRKTDFRNWITRNYLLSNAFNDHGVFPFNETKPIREIGPGLGAVLTLASLSSPKTVYSYDTSQMQRIFDAIQRMFPTEFKTLVRIPVNMQGQNLSLVGEREGNLIAFWSFTELKEDERTGYFEIIRESKNAIIATNQYFEGINNFDYLEEMALKLNKTISFKNLTELFGESLPEYQKKHRIYLLQQRQA